MREDEVFSLSVLLVIRRKVKSRRSRRVTLHFVMGKPACMVDVGATRITLFIICMLPLVFSQADDLFTAGVYEHIKVEDNIYGVQRNLDIYENVSFEAARRGADVIVFPELGVLPDTGNRTLVRQFTETIPDPKETTHWVPCLQRPPKNPILTRLSCMARNNRIIVVANIADEQPCKANETCRSDGVHIFNTNVAFDKNGTFVARYHKRFLFFEDAYDRPDEPNYIIFDTEFGRFGLITCFDILFNESVHLVEKYHVDTIIAPVWWHDELPFLSSIQIFYGWAITQRVNLLLANIHLPEYNAVGSGIFSGHFGALNYTHKPDNHSVLVTANLLRKPSNYSNDLCLSNNPPIKEDYDFASTSAIIKDNTYHFYITDMSNYTIVPLNNQAGDLVSCNNGLCCNLHYSASKFIEHYYLAARRGIRDIRNHYFWYEEVCTVFKCQLNNGTCTNISLDASATFNNFHLQGNFSTKYVYPSVVGPQLALTPHGSWNFSIHENVCDLRFKSGPPLLFATLFGRVYNKDPEYHP